MELSIFLAKVFGLMMLLVGLGMLLDKKSYEKMFKELSDSYSDLLTHGFLALFAGVAMVTYHNIWEGEWWVVLITIFGWISLLKGVLRLLFPGMVMGMLKSFLKNKSFMMWSGWASIALGAAFSYYGFIA